MAAANENVDRTYEIIDISTLNQVGKTNTHLIYLCPECKKKLGKPDLKGKLYYSIDKDVGLCFRCNTVFYPEEDENDPNYEMKDLRDNIEKYSKRNGYIDGNFSEVAMRFSPLETDLLVYLKGRNPLLINIVDILGLGGWYGKDRGVVTPFIYDGKVIKFQVRYTTREKGNDEYYTMPGPKVLYSPFHTSTRLFEERTITICEGTYDAIALAIMGYPNPLAILGKAITPVQIYQIKKLVPYNCFIAMDQKKLGWAIHKQLKYELQSVSDYIVFDFDGPDPEEYLRDKFFFDENFRNSCIENVQKWRQGKLREA